MCMANDIIGTALNDYFHEQLTAPLLLHTSYGEVEEMPVDEFFRDPDDFPELEHIALALCDGRILDIGAGAGSHALCLQDKGMDVYALDISPRACTLMKKRGVERVINADVFEYREAQYDTLLFLMNGIGVAEGIVGLKKLLRHGQSLLREGGQLLFDSSDIAYLYADGSVRKPAGYYGEIQYQYEYKGRKSSPFGWLYIDQNTLIQLAHTEGWVVQVLYEDENDQYLARMVRRDQSIHENPA